MVKNQFYHACVITPTYPDNRFIERGAFVENLVRIWKTHGMTVDVVAPRSYANILRAGTKKKRVASKIAGDKIVYPSYISVSNKQMGPVDLERITRKQFTNAVFRGLKQFSIPDFYYGKFLMRGGIAASIAGKINRKPVIADIGEHLLFDELNRSDIQEAQKIVRLFDGITCVSEELASDVIHLGANPDKVFVYPNTVDLKRFFPMDREACRAQLNLPANIPIAVFVGNFIERKGPLRVLEALQKLENFSSVKGMFIGRGQQKPKGDTVLFAEPVLHDKLPIWLNAADVFILPTLHEGHCNAINEAMACGLPVISSDIPEIRLQVPDDAGMLVNPNQSEELVEAIKKIISDKDLRTNMGKKAAELQKERSSVERATAVFEWIQNVLT